MSTAIKLENKIKDLSPQLIKELKNVIKFEWTCILKNLPQIKSGDLTLKETTLKTYSESEDPPGKAIDFMISKAVTLKDLQESFEALDFESGLLFLNKPETPIKVTRLPFSKIQIQYNNELEVVCQAEGFPKPTYEYYNNGIKVSDGPVFKRLNATEKDAGKYKCVIIQKRSNEIFKEVINFEVIVRNVLFKKSMITLPVRQEANIGEATSITALSNESLTDLEFEWYKFNRQNGQIERLSSNPTYNCSSLLIPRFETKDIGVYQCHVSQKSTGTKVFSNQCELTASKLSNFDLKLALIIGNSNYETDDEEIKRCKQCQTLKYSKVRPCCNLLNLNVYSAFQSLKQRLESIGYLVFSFLDLDATSYLRALYTAKNICSTARSVSVLIYVAGHGYNWAKEDFLIPINTETLLHNNGHEIHTIRHEHLSLCSLNNLLENFKPVVTEQNVSVVCFWDLCRGEWFEWSECSNDSTFKEKLNFSIIFCCNVGKNGYEISSDVKELNLRKGPIFLNVLINNLEPNLTFHELGVKMKLDIQTLKDRRPSMFEKLSNLIFFSTLENHDLSAPAKKNSEFSEAISKFYIEAGSLEDRKPYQFNGESILAYRFLPDTFINSLLLEVEILTRKPCSYTVTYQSLIYIDQVESEKHSVSLFRIRNFLAAKRLNLDVPIKLEVIIVDSNKPIEIKIKLPEELYQIFDLMNTPEIDTFIEEKKRSEREKLFGDDISVSSYDVFEVSSNDGYIS